MLAHCGTGSLAWRKWQLRTAHHGQRFPPNRGDSDRLIESKNLTTNGRLHALEFHASHHFNNKEFP
jgi:hypothetical protein